MAFAAAPLRQALKGTAPTLKFERSLWDAGVDVVAGVDEVGRGSWAGPLTVAAVVANPRRRIYKVRDSKMLTLAEREVLHDRILEWARATSVGHATVAECTALGMAQAQRLAARRAVDGLNLRVDHVLLDGAWDFVSATDPVSGRVSGNGYEPGSVSGRVSGGGYESLSVNGNGYEPGSGSGEVRDNGCEPLAVSGRLIGGGYETDVVSGKVTNGPDKKVGVTTIVRGDAQSLSIAAASVVAKVTRDRIMIAAADFYPAYWFNSNKGYPCPRHKAALAAWGPSAIHRRRWVFMDNLRWNGDPRIVPSSATDCSTDDDDQCHAGHQKLF